MAQTYGIVSCGSSPRMRGAQGVVRVHAPVGWIIPADAGSTDFVDNAGGLSGDHPRGCGEHSVPGISLCR